MEYIIVIFIILSLIISLFTSNKNRNTTNTKEDNLDWTGLEEWEKEKVRNGEADIYSFEEGELEDDDYYYEDGE